MQAISLPPELQPHADFIADGIRKALEDSKVAPPDEIEVVRPTAKQFGVGELTLVMLLIGKGSVVWFTKKWIDQYLWPVLRPQLDKPSRKVIEFLTAHAPSPVTDK